MIPRFVASLVLWTRELIGMGGGAGGTSALSPMQSGAGPAKAAPMLDCESVMRQLWDYLDGELTPERMAAMHHHLELCKRCYPQYEFERSFLEAIAARRPHHSNLDGLRARLMQALHAQGLSKT